jgi:hypothetical protein
MPGNGLRKGIGDGLQQGNFSELGNQLEQLKKKTILFTGMNVGVAAAIVGMVAFSYYYFVWRYAVIDEVKMTQDAAEPIRVWFDFKVLQGGYLEYGHEKSLLGEPVETGEKKHFRYGRHVAGKKEFQVFVRSRTGPFPSWTTKTFQVSGGK